MARIFVTGDCHASYNKLSFKSFPESRELTKGDYVIICGDFGLWDESNEMNYWLDWLEERPFTTLWVDGNHENFDLLKKYPVETWNGGNVHFIRPSVIHLMRGQLFTIADKTFFAFGGARSHDIQDGILEMDDPLLKEKVRFLESSQALYRINHLSWWAEEMPDETEMECGVKTLNDAGWKADYIITHCCPSSLLCNSIPGIYENDALTDYFSFIHTRCAFRHWFFGHYHVNEDWGQKETCLYRHIVELTADGYKDCGLAHRFSCRERVRFTTYGFQGKKELTGTITHIDEQGGGFYLGDQPTANIRTDEGHYHKNIPFEDIRKLDEEDGAT